MPHSGPRASPLRENRQGSLAIIIAAATVAPIATRIGLPFTVIEQSLLIRRILPFTRSLLNTFSISQYIISQYTPDFIHYYGQSRPLHTHASR
jgi:hypothetical protein